MNIVLCFLLSFSSSLLVTAQSSKNDPTKHWNWKQFEYDRCGMTNTDRIIGGKDAPLGSHPWLARVGFINRGRSPLFGCGAALISPRYVLTAAHCFERTTNVMVRLGEHDTQTNPDCDEDDFCSDPVRDYAVEEVIVHEDFNSDTFLDDIALIKLRRPVKFTEFIRPVCLPVGELVTKNFTGEIAEVAGWGVMDMATKAVSRILQVLRVPITNTEDCRVQYKDDIDVTDSQICAGGIEDEDSCSGDSGGPLVKNEAANDHPPRYYVIGVVSFGLEECGTKSRPGVYTEVTKYLDWILDNAASEYL